VGVKTVWVLGAGFSRSLGGVLLDDLLSPATNNLVQALYADNVYIGHCDGPRDDGARHAAQAVRLLYEEYGPKSRTRTVIWTDAEAFLDQLDAAARSVDGAAAKRILRTLDRLGLEPPLYLPDLHTAARRLVAAACCAFLKEADLDEERWQPYREWARKTDGSDSVVTFNYDRVLELTKNQFKFVMPGKWQPPPEPNVPRVYKLHGSVDWNRAMAADGTITWRPDNPEFSLLCKADQIGIATPGPTKRLSAEELNLVWTGALDRLREANVIVFVGYRFPPSDAEAREKLLWAVRENTSKHLELHIVLGADRSLPDVVRLQELLRYSLARAGRAEHDARTSFDPQNFVGTNFRLSTHALFAEDFLTVWDRPLLWKWRDPDEPRPE
jgi:hypothetical protein